MSAFQPRPEDLPQEFPIFPLEGALLLPHGRLPLNVFEARYLAMVEDALAGGRMIGMIQPDPQGARAPAGPGLYPTGCLGRLSSFSETEDGRYLVTLTGVIRFAVQQELDLRRGYRRVRAEFARWRADLDDADSQPAPQPSPLRETLTGALRAYFAARGFEADWDAIAAMPDGSLVTTLAMVCPFEPGEKQALLEAPGPAERTQALLALLQMGAAMSGGETPRYLS